MGFGLGFFGGGGVLPISSERVYFRAPARSHRRAWVELRHAGREHLENWEPDYEGDFASLESFHSYLRHINYLRRSRRGEGWLIFRCCDDELLGGITLANMRFGSVRSGDIGYWVGESYVRQGYMSESFELLFVRAFRHYGLNRLCAAVLPENDASRCLLEKFDFCYEGTARQYLRINGSFRDHRLYALLSADYFARIG